MKYLSVCVYTVKVFVITGDPFFMMTPVVFSAEFQPAASFDLVAVTVAKEVIVCV